MRKTNYWPLIGLALAVATVIALLLIGSRLTQMQQTQEDTLNQLTELQQTINAEPISQVAEPVSLGTFTITHYCPCEICCGEWANGITYTGTVATEGRTIGVDPDVIPLGSTVIIGGHEYVAEDIGGGVMGQKIDMFMSSHDAAIAAGVYEVEVFLWEQDI